MKIGCDEKKLYITLDLNNIYNNYYYYYYYVKYRICTCQVYLFPNLKKEN